MEQETFNIKKYKQRQKAMLRNLTDNPNSEISLVGKVIMCSRDKPEWIILCNANQWDC